MAAVQIPPVEPWWKGAVLYQIYPRSFVDTNGDGVGDLAGVAVGLDHVASLGVDAIWLSPFFVSPMKDNGYDVADYCDVDPVFGTLADADAVIARAHGLGLRVIIDMVCAHTSDRHRWFASSAASPDGPHGDWYVWADAKPDGSPPTNWQSLFGGPGWTWNASRRQYYMHNFLKEQPQLNVRNLAAQDALLDAMRFWLNRGIDGFRLDAINYAMHDAALTDNPPLRPDGCLRTRPFDFQVHLHNQSQPDIPAFLRRIRALADSYGDIFLVGEVGGEWAGAEMKSYTADDRHLHSCYSFAFLSAEQLTGELIESTVGEWSGVPGEGWPSWAFSNHDAPRVASRWAPDDGAPLSAEVSMALLLALRGNPFIYQGEELGLPHAHIPFDALRDVEAIANWPHGLGRDGARTPLPWTAAAEHAGFSSTAPWLPIDARHIPLAIDRQHGDRLSALERVRRLLALRRQLPVLATGSFTVLTASTPLLGFDRGDGAQSVRCLYNLTDRSVRTGLLDGWHIIMDSNATPQTGARGVTETMTLEPWSAVWALPHRFAQEAVSL